MAIISDTIIGLLNFRIQQEEQSARLYKSMAICLNDRGYVGAAQLWQSYSVEELDHANWAIKYLQKLGIKPELAELEKPQSEFKDLQNILALSYKHEYEVLEQCKELANACIQDSDYMTLQLAQKYLTEQAEELEKLTIFIDMLESFGDGKAFLKILDQEMAKHAKNGNKKG